jgi:hypothetical protein
MNVFTMVVADEYFKAQISLHLLGHYKAYLAFLSLPALRVARGRATRYLSPK